MSDALDDLLNRLRDAVDAEASEGALLRALDGLRCLTRRAGVRIEDIRQEARRELIRRAGRVPSALEVAILRSLRDPGHRMSATELWHAVNPPDRACRKPSGTFKQKLANMRKVLGWLHLDRGYGTTPLGLAALEIAERARLF